MIRAAGIILQSPEGRVIMLQRSLTGDHAGEWCFPGGGVEDGETTANAALREVLEETGYRVGAVGSELCTRVAEDVHFTTYLNKVDEEFVPRLNGEHVAFAWIAPKDALAQYVPQPIVAAPGVM
jgi:8-oxo-dGTP pyrophosphatase MutT (NUDIX family)